MHPENLKLIACPACRSELALSGDKLTCSACAHAYTLENDIPRLFAPDDRLMVDVKALRIKSSKESRRTIAEMQRVNSGFIGRSLIFYVLYVLVIVFVAFGIWVAVGAVLALLLADWIYFRTIRASALRRYQKNPLRLESIHDHAAIDSIFAAAGSAQPSMADWISLLRGTPDATATREELDDERYRDIKRVYDTMSSEPKVIVDVGANDGSATATFGVGRGRTVIGVDVSQQLLRTFRDNVPGGIALQADGCRLPIASSSVDFLLCTETLEHLADPGAAVAEFVRVLKPGGRFVVQSPNAHRIRNLNPFHLLTLLVSLINDGVLQKKSVHENTWHNAVTFHWDFSRQDYQRTLVGQPAKMNFLGSRDFFFPEFLIRGRLDAYRRKEHSMRRVPLMRHLGGDLVMVVEKLQ